MNQEEPNRRENTVLLSIIPCDKDDNELIE